MKRFSVTEYQDKPEGVDTIGYGIICIICKSRIYPYSKYFIVRGYDEYSICNYDMVCSKECGEFVIIQEMA